MKRPARIAADLAMAGVALVLAFAVGTGARIDGSPPAELRRGTVRRERVPPPEERLGSTDDRVALRAVAELAPDGAARARIRGVRHHVRPPLSRGRRAA